MRYRSVAAGIAAMLPGLVLGQGVVKHQCTYGSLERHVEVFYETADAVPCEVHYRKVTEVPGERLVLWRANNEAGFCERKTSEFIAKLQDAGWNCGEANRPKPEAAGELDDEASDTDVLAPAADGSADDAL